MKSIFKAAALCLILGIFAGCASQPAPQPEPQPLTEAEQRAASGRSANPVFPRFVNDAVRNAPADALVGVGQAKFATLNMSRTMAISRARSDIARTMRTMARNMIEEHQRGTELDLTAATTFAEIADRNLSEATLVGAVVIEEDMDVNDMYWAVVYLSKTYVVNEINQALASAKLAVPAMAAYNAQERMDEAFSRALNEEIRGVDQ